MRKKTDMLVNVKPIFYYFDIPDGMHYEIIKKEELNEHSRQIR